MNTWGWVALAVIVVAIVLLVAATLMRRRTVDLRRTFGPEYERTVEADGRRKGESELAERRERVERLEIRPLTDDARERYAAAWQDVQARFVDDPPRAVGEADRLVMQVMGERGYPTADFEQRVADISVEHPDVVEDYRATRRVADANRNGRAGTEDLRRAMIHYRRLFENLLQSGADQTGRA